jgi:hypothetical protein
MTWIQIHSHRRADLVSPTVADMGNIGTIAHSLGNICRFGGHTIRHYPVAQHCLVVSTHAEQEATEMVSQGHQPIATLPGIGQFPVTPATLGLWGLLHDADEPYCGDPTRPYMEALRAIDPRAAIAVRELKSKIQEVIADSFGLHRGFMHDLWIVEADNAALGEEARQLLAGGPVDDWDIGLPSIHLAAATVVRSVYTPKQATDAFLDRYRVLQERRLSEAGMVLPR